MHEAFKLRAVRTGMTDTMSSNLRLTAPERAFAAAQKALFRDLGLEVGSRFLWPETPARRVHVLDTGSGEPLLMIHGGNSVAAGWAPLLAELGGRFHVYAPDRPGCGLTHRQNYRRVSFREHAVAFIQEVMDGLGLQRATLAGNSMGGYWALAFALAHPERVARVALLGEPAGSNPARAARLRLAGTPLINRLLFATLLRPRRGPRLFTGLMADPERASPALIDCAYAGAVLPGARDAWRTMLELVVAPGKAVDLTQALVPELPRLACPVLFAWGDHDFVPAADGREISRHLPHARFEVVPDAGHLAWIDQPEAVARLLTDFMAADVAGSFTEADRGERP